MSINWIKLDNANDYLKKKKNKLSPYFQNGRIILESSCVDYPKNGIVEMKNSHLLHITRTFFCFKKCSKILLGEGYSYCCSFNK